MHIAREYQTFVYMLRDGFDPIVKECPPKSFTCGPAARLEQAS